MSVRARARGAPPTKPGDDLLTDLIAAEEGGDRLDTEDLESLAVAVLVAGTDTTRNQLACTVALFTKHPEQWKLLAERLSSPRERPREHACARCHPRHARFATEDIEYKGVLFLRTRSSRRASGREQRRPVFPEPETFDITARATSPHLTFGSGIHYCLGRGSHAELQEALPILAQRMPDLEVDGEIEWKPDSTGIWGPARLPLRFSPV
jgi:cytochrome P450